MQIHVFVATPEGLVAINKILPMPSGVQSSVTFADTCEPCPIERVYVNFVKRGVGIIQDDFGGDAYRVDVSRKISNGNSWQLGFYIAHAAYHANVLGDGKNLAKEDLVICATGEIKTASRGVSAVDNVTAKFTAAESQIAQWQQTNKVAVFAPNENSEHIPKHLTGLITTLSHLDDVYQYLPLDHPTQSTNDDEVTTLCEPDSQPELPVVIPKNKVATKKPVYFGGLALVFGLAVAYLSVSGEIFDFTHQGPVNLPQAEAPTTLSKAQVVQSTDEHQLTLWAEYSDDCERSPIQTTEFELNESTFTPVTEANRLCWLKGEASSNVSQVVFVGLQQDGVHVKYHSSNQVTVFKPRQSIGIRPYYLLTFSDDLNNTEKEEIDRYLQTYNRPMLMSTQDITTGLQAVTNSRFSVFKHSFEIEHW